MFSLILFWGNNLILFFLCMKCIWLNFNYIWNGFYIIFFIKSWYYFFLYNVMICVWVGVWKWSGINVVLYLLLIKRIVFKWLYMLFFKYFLDGNNWICFLCVWLFNISEICLFLDIFFIILGLWLIRIWKLFFL